MRSFLALALGIGFSAAACGPPDDRSAAEAGAAGEPDELTTITLLVMGNEWDLRPSMNRPPMHLLFLPLFSRNRNGELEGRLVRSWESSEDGKTWTYHLRTDVLWHDGVPFSARDIEYSIDLKRQRLYETPKARQVEIVDDSTVRITYGASNRPPLDSWYVYLPSHLLSEMTADELWESDFWDHPIGNGPYRYVRHIPETMVELEANPDFYLGRPPIDRVILKLRGAPAWMELERGDVDVAGWAMIGGSEAVRLADNPDFRTYWMHGPGVHLMFYNHRHPALRDTRVRRAITHAIDREAMARVYFNPDEAALFDVPLNDRLLLEGEFPAPVSYNLQLAREILDEAGWRDDDGDGVRERGEIELRLSLLAEHERSGVLIQESLRQLGIAVEIQILAPGIHMERLRSGEYDLITETETPRTLFPHLLGDPPGVDPPSGYLNPRLVELVEAFKRAVEPAAQDSLLRAMWPIFQQDVPVTYLLPQIWFNAAHKRVKGLSSPYRVWAETHMEELWIEEEK